MSDRLSVPIRHLARIATVVFALFVLGWLVVNAQRNANRGAGEPETAVAPAATPTEPPPEFLYSSKSIVIEPRVLQDPSIGPVETVIVPPAEVFLPSSKVGRPGVVPPLAPASGPGPESAQQGPRERRS
jgi:hypothetical protein